MSKWVTWFYLAQNVHRGRKHPKRANLGLRGPTSFFALYMYNECTINV